MYYMDTINTNKSYTVISNLNKKILNLKMLSEYLNINY
jgi:hypothetical protein